MHNLRDNKIFIEKIALLDANFNIDHISEALVVLCEKPANELRGASWLSLPIFTLCRKKYASWLQQFVSQKNKKYGEFVGKTSAMHKEKLVVHHEILSYNTTGTKWLLVKVTMEETAVMDYRQFLTMLNDKLHGLAIVMFDRKSLDIVHGMGNEIGRLNLSNGNLKHSPVFKIISPVMNKEDLQELSFEKKIGKDYYIIWIIPGLDVSQREKGLIIFQKVTYLRQNEKELQKAKDNAERASAMKTSFIANVSHELRTPLNAIIGFTEQLSKTTLGDSQKEYVSIVNQAAEHLLGLVNDVLSVSKLEAGELPVENEPFSLKNMVGEAYDQLKFKAERKKIDFLNQYDIGYEVILMGDAYKIKQVLINLLNNAIKFTGKGHVKIMTRLINDTKKSVNVRFDIIDTGMGISKKHQKTIFDKYRQLEQYNSKNNVGSGLGLTISKSLSELMGGTLEVDSVPEKGSVFSFTVPLKKSQKEFIFSEKIIIDSASLKDKNVLIVDDDDVNLYLAKIILNGFKCNIRLAGDGKKAIELVEQFPFDLLLLDIKMPGIDGYQVAEKVRKSKLNKNTRMIALSASVLREDIARYKQAGIDAYLKKPIKEAELFFKMCDVLGIQVKEEDSKIKERVLILNEEQDLYDLSELIKVAPKNSDFFRDMIKTFTNSVLEGLEKLDKHLKSLNYKEIGETAHKLLPSFRHLQVTNAIDILEELKSLEDEKQDEENTIEKIRQLNNITKKVIKELSVYLID